MWGAGLIMLSYAHIHTAKIIAPFLKENESLSNVEAADQHNILRLSTLQHIYCIIGVSFTVVYMMRIVKIPCYFDFCLREKVDWQPRDWLSSETDQNFEFFNLTLIGFE